LDDSTRKYRKKHTLPKDFHDRNSLFRLSFGKTYPFTFVSAAEANERVADCRTMALLAKRAAVERIMVISMCTSSAREKVI
jgi:hypothetical protein